MDGLRIKALHFHHDLDEDLSLKSFLQEEIIRSVEYVLGKTA